MSSSASSVCVVNNVQYMIKNKDDLIQKTLLHGQQWNDHIISILKDLITQRKLTHFVNVGAHIGTVSIPVSKVVSKVTAVEPYPPSFEHLNANIQLNEITNIRTFNCAFGNSTEPVYFMNPNLPRVKYNSGGMHVFTSHDISNKIRSSELSDGSISSNIMKMDDTDIDEFDIMLVDIEGCEYDFLLGAKKKLLQYKPIIIIEIWNDTKRRNENMNTSQQSVLDLLSSFGYNCRSIQNSDDFLCIAT